VWHKTHIEAPEWQRFWSTTALTIEANLSGAKLSEADLSGADLHRADLSLANLSGANLFSADLRRANLFRADFSGATFFQANLFQANLREADLFNASLRRANLSEADLSGADLRGANLGGASLVKADLANADLTGCAIFGVSAWKLNLNGAKQENLIITESGEPEITVDNIEVAQFIYLLLNNEKIRGVIDTITSKGVLILGRFTPARKAVLDAMRNELRKRGYLPILFDFDKPANQTTDETITLLARMARFVIADISDAKSVLQELRAIIPEVPSVAVQPLILRSQEEPGMFDFFNPRLRPSVLETHRYDTPEQLIADLGERVIRPAELKVQELRPAQ
jgi:uncharacterized protein YjbI with pentapeptide repeats